MVSILPAFQGLEMICSIVLAVVGIALIAVLDRVSDPYQKDSQLADRTALVLTTLFVSLIIISILLALL